MLDDDFLTAKEAAEFLHTTESSLRTQRSKGKGPPFHKPDGWRTLYRRSELEAYHASCGPSGRRSRMERAIAEKKRAALGSTRVRP
ncbi:helix-turn-helix domain-containing protein [Sphingosinicella humi]|uniref:Helix-turn-helix domain-containing protein n=1 Tax=Allosphingosinicella humi TaxID=2068657 RepID=A0A2U2J4L8_9SPHN|nr:helix-turn-helix domain-containing protein [Sphingosinicella humi]PWG03299.1 hypothetical protein DF286_10795 [Sphingosinicella humi]